jgi:hypothetical protein
MKQGREFASVHPIAPAPPHIAGKGDPLKLVIALITFAALTLPAYGAVTPEPYIATYAVSYRGFSVGELRFELRSEEPERFVLEVQASPHLLARIFVGRKALERSVMQIDAEGVRPLSWFVEDGKSGNRKDGELDYDWDKGRVSGIVEGKQLVLPTEAGLQDRTSLQVAVMTKLLRGEEPGAISVLDSDRVRHYSYDRLGVERIRTEAGEFETVLYVSTRIGSSRLSRVWHAPSLGYIPVRAEQRRNGKVETVMELVRVERQGD